MNFKSDQLRAAVRGFFTVCLTAWLGIFAFPLRSQTVDAAAEHKKAREEFVQAEQAAQKRQVSTESFQRELARLVEQKDLLQRELSNAKGKIAFADEKAKYAGTTGARDEIERWRGQSESWMARVKAAEAELAKVDADIQATVQALQTSLKQSDEGAVLLPGESIEIFIAEDETLNGVYQIRRGGYIILPRVGRVMLAGKSIAEAEQAIKQAVGQTQVKDATVMVERPQNGVSPDGAAIYLAGEFLKPGVWKIPTGTSPTLVTAVLRSGGYTPAADLTKVRLLRLVSGQPLIEEVNVQAILDGGVGLNTDLTLHSGDIVMLPAFANVVYVTGNVVKPGPLPLRPDNELTAYSAILRAGGFSRFANRKKVYVLRDQTNGSKKKIPVNIKDVQSGGLDVILQSKDIVVVPEKFFSF